MEAISTATGTPHAFVSLRTGGPMMHFWKRPNNTWTPFVTSLGGEYFRKFKVIRNRDGRFEIFGLRDSDGGIYHRWVQSAAIPVDWASSSTWSDWEKLTDVSSYYDFSIAENSDGRLEIFAIDVQFRRVRHAWQLAPGSSWSDWRTIEVLGVMGNDLRHINASTDREGRLAVFVDDSMHFTCTATQTAANQGPWIGWTNI